MIVLLAVGAIDHHEIAVGDRAQAHRVGRIAVGDPVPALPFVMQHALRFEIAEHLGQRLAGRSVRRRWNGSSNAAQRMWSIRISGWSGAMRACSGEAAAKNSGLPHDVLVERLAELATSTPSAGRLRRPARPKRCQVAATVPG